MNPRTIRLLSVLAIMVISVVVASAETISEKEDTKGILADSAVVDLGNHKVAYLTGSYELEKTTDIRNGLPFRNWIREKNCILRNGILYLFPWRVE